MTGRKIKITDKIFDRFRGKWKKIIWIKAGIYYGYPKCCIINFCDRGFKLTKEQRKLYNSGYGFIPCPYHSKRVYNKKITLRSLINNRECKNKLGKYII